MSAAEITGGTPTVMLATWPEAPVLPAAGLPLEAELEQAATQATSAVTAAAAAPSRAVGAGPSQLARFRLGAFIVPPS
jgi:hypothetical protein